MILKTLTVLFAPFVLSKVLLTGSPKQAALAWGDIKAIIREEW